MFDALRSLFAEIAHPDGREFQDDDYRLAAAALLVHVADVDGVTSTAETERLETLLANWFGLDFHAARRLIDAARLKDREVIDLREFSDVLKRSLDSDGRLRVVAMMWDMAHADGKVHEFEAAVISRVAELLDVSDADPMAPRRGASGDPEKGSS